MTFFSEIYGAYFRAVSRILSQGACTDKELQQMVSEEAFGESWLALEPHLKPEKPESWGLLRRLPDGRIGRVTKHAPPGFLTMLQKRWLKTKLSDPRMRLFLSEEAFAALSEELYDVEPLFRPEMLYYYDRFSDGDRYDSEVYRGHFRRILQGLHDHEVLHIRFVNGKNVQCSGWFLPLRLEYSQKNDKFRLFCCHLFRNGSTDYGIINLGRIMYVQGTGRTEDPARYLRKWERRRRCPVPVLLEVSGERNGIERFMTEFASYEKHTERDPETGRCRVQLWYDRQDETEVLIRLLGFGPVLEILGPPAFRRQAAERVRRQYALLQGKELGKFFSKD